MSTTEEIATWLEHIHCDRIDDPDDIDCIKSNCILFRDLANRIREGEYKDDNIK